ncbi:uncharacterized protein LOC124613666 [Schistocerca americana]|uniref:uncharacterized protein LOC124613666 n=1 Tax=Schistocerca americana TaxID=7009 RepID=UPI001F500C93|nr:uncharacterized protein LOC124613666 [Schistocerca americana]
MKQKEKFEKLAVKVRKEEVTVDPKRVVVHLSSEVVDEAAVSVLAKGLNFATIPKRMPVEEIISTVEVSLFRLPKVQAEEVRQDASRVLRKAKPPKSNILAQKRKSLNELMRSESIVVSKLDKGNATVVLDAVDYYRNMEQLLSDAVYRKSKNDPTNRIVKKVKNLVQTPVWTALLQEICDQWD